MPYILTQNIYIYFLTCINPNPSAVTDSCIIWGKLYDLSKVVSSSVKWGQWFTFRTIVKIK